jgi:hypothetical protein
LADLLRPVPATVAVLAARKDISAQFEIFASKLIPTERLRCVVFAQPLRSRWYRDLWFKSR